MIKKTIYILLTVIIIGAGILYYNLEIKEYDIQDETVNEVIGEQYKVENPNITMDNNLIEGESVGNKDSNNNPNSDSINKSESENQNQSQKQSKKENKSTPIEKDNNNISSSDKTKTSSKNEENGHSNDEEKEINKINESNQPKETQTVSKQKLLNTYTNAFENLESQANTKIKQVLEHALNEYQIAKESGKDVSYMYFYKKYSSAEEKLEKQTDNTFDQLYSSLQSDLKKYGYSTSEAKIYKTKYEERKKERRKKIIRKALDMF